MLDDLNAVCETEKFEEDGFIVLTGFDRDGTNATLRFRVHTTIDGDAPQAWRVDCRGVEAFALEREVAYGIEIVDDDPALWPYNQPGAALYCVGVIPEQGTTLLGALYQAHVGAVGKATGALRFGDRLNASHAFSGGSGLVARGPMPLIEAYQHALEAHGVRTSILSGRRPQRRTEGRWVDMPEDIKLLVLGGNWVVADSFSAVREG